MASAPSFRDTESHGRGALPLVVAGLFLVLGAALVARAELGLWMSNHHAHVIDKALLALDRGRIEIVGFVYPPLPLLLLLPMPSTILAGLLAATCGAATVWILTRTLLRASLPRPVAVALVLALASPSMFFLFTQSLWEALLLLLLLVGWNQSIEFIARGNVRAGAIAGLTLGLAFLANYYALLFALPFGLAALLFVRTDRRGAGPAAAFMLLFPVIAALLSWMYLSWVFTADPWSFTRDQSSSMFAFLRADGADLPRDWSSALSATARDLRMSPLYVVMAIVVAWYRPLRLPVMLVFGVFVLGLRALGFVLPDYFAAVGFTMVALAATPAALPRHLLPLLVLAAVAQLGIGWVTPLRGEAAAWQSVVSAGVARPADQEELGVGQLLAGRPPRSVLIDDRTDYRVIARAGTARPFVTSVDPLYGLAMSQPARFVPSMLARTTGWAHADQPGLAPAIGQPGMRLTRLSPRWSLYEWRRDETALRGGDETARRDAGETALQDGLR